MRCPACFGKTRVIDTEWFPSAVPSQASGFILRRRACLPCATRFTTQETFVGLDKRRSDLRKKRDDRRT